MTRWTGLMLVAGMMVPGAAAAQGHGAHSQHAGHETREIRALSAEEMAALLAGEGMGQALAAELNGYPGPRHVLELADALALTASQSAAVAAIFEAMAAEAKRLGAEVVAKERELDRRFSERTIDAGRLTALTAELGSLRGELRNVHLQAHLQTTALLTADQIHRYDMERGYHGAGHE